MAPKDLSAFANRLRKEGFAARNLADVGITVWQGRDGFFFSAEELSQLPLNFSVREFEQLLKGRRETPAAG